MPSSRWSFSLFPGRVARRAFRGAVGRRKRQPFPPPKRARRTTCASGGSMDGRRFGRAPKSASFSRGGRLKMAGLMSEAALGTFCCARCTRNRPLGRAFPVRIVNGFHPPKVAKRKLTSARRSCGLTPARCFANAPLKTGKGRRTTGNAAMQRPQKCLPAFLSAGHVCFPAISGERARKKQLKRRFLHRNTRHATRLPLRWRS